MPTPTYDLIASNVLSSSASSVTFSSIPATYRDLIVVADIRGFGSSPDGFRGVLMRFNSDTGSNYNNVRMAGDGSAATSNSTANGTSIEVTVDRPSSADTNAFLFQVQLLDYSATDKHKSSLIRYNNSARGVAALAGRWASTSAITSVSFEPTQPDPTTFDSGSSFYLYGIVS